MCARAVIVLVYPQAFDTTINNGVDLGVWKLLSNCVITNVSREMIHVWRQCEAVIEIEKLDLVWPWLREAGEKWVVLLRWLIIAVSTAASWQKNLTQVLYSSSVSHDSLQKNTKLIDSSYCFPKLTWPAHSLLPTKNRQGYITYSPVLLHFEEIQHWKTAW